MYLPCQLKKPQQSACFHALKELQTVFRVFPKTETPWLPIAVRWPYIFFGHFNPDASNDVWGFCEELVLRVRLDEKTYAHQKKELGELLLGGSGSESISVEGVSTFEQFLKYTGVFLEKLGRKVDLKELEKDKLFGWLFRQKSNNRPVLPLREIVFQNEAVLQELGLSEEEKCSVVALNETLFLVDDENLQAQFTLRGKGMRFLSIPKAVREELMGTTAQIQIVDEENTDSEWKVEAILDCTMAKAERTSDPVSIFRTVLSVAVENGVSDIHAMRNGENGEVFFRQDSLLVKQDTLTMGTALFGRFLSIVCQQSGIEPYKRLVPHGGRFSAKFPHGVVDVRVSVIPHEGQQSLVMRVLDNRAKSFGLNDLRLPERELLHIRCALAKKSGLIVVTGPTGSGKSTMLYALLENLAQRKGLSIQTIEEPVERHINGIRQFQVERREDPKVDLPFARIFRDVLRHDPDVVMVGEVRDAETAQLAVQAANTGHLVLTTLHTNSALGAVQRFLTFWASPDQLAEAIILLQAQRLVRTMCSNCPKDPAPKEEVEVAIELMETLLGEKELVRLGHPKGCTDCQQTGFRGRRAVFEVLPMSIDLRTAIAEGRTTSHLLFIAKEHGFQSLFQHGLRLVKENICSLREICSHADIFELTERTRKYVAQYI